MATYSPSRLSAFEKCPLSYRFTYIDRIKKEEESIDAFVGSRVHEALEKLLKLKMDFGREPTLEKAREIYLKRWEEEYGPHIVIKDEFAEEEDYKRKGLICLEKYFDMEKGREPGELVDLELQLNFNLGGCSMTGFIDRIEKVGNTYHIIDYKTSKRAMTQEEADTDRQLALYEIGIRDMFPDAEDVMLHWYYLQHGQVVSSSRDESQLEELSESVVSLIETIETTTDFLPLESKLCGWCEYKDECEAEKRKRTLDASRLEPPIEELVEEYASLSEERRGLNAEVKKIEKRLEELKRGFMGVAKDTGAWSIEGSEHALDLKISEDFYIPGKGSEARRLLEEIICSAGAYEEMSVIDKSCILKAIEEGRYKEIGPQILEKFSRGENLKVKVRDIGPRE